MYYKTLIDIVLFTFNSLSKSFKYRKLFRYSNKPKLTLITKLYNFLAASSATAIRIQQIVDVIFKS